MQSTRRLSRERKPITELKSSLPEGLFVSLGFFQEEESF